MTTKPAQTNIRYSEKLKPFILAFFNLRRAVGWIGIALPPVLIVGTLVLQGTHGPEPSISHYYFTVMGDVFVGALCAIAFFLIAYPGYTRVDAWLSTFAGIFALLIAFFPTGYTDANPCVASTGGGGFTSGDVHLIAAFLFFSILAWLAIFEFTKTDPGSTQPPTPEKLLRNKIFRWCGGIMAACLALMVLVVKTNLGCLTASWYPVLLLEVIALLAFGYCWLIKGEMWFRDNGLLTLAEENPDVKIG